MITDIASHFIAQSRGFLSSDYLQKIERCLEILSDEEVWFQVRASRRRVGNAVCESCANPAAVLLECAPRLLQSRHVREPATAATHAVGGTSQADCARRSSRLSPLESPATPCHRDRCRSRRRRARRVGRTSCASGPSNSAAASSRSMTCASAFLFGKCPVSARWICCSHTRTARLFSA